MNEMSKCPVMHGHHLPTSNAAMTNRRWWPNQLNLKVLHQNPPAGDPMEPDFDYAKAFTALDLGASYNFV